MAGCPPVRLGEGHSNVQWLPGLLSICKTQCSWAGPGRTQAAPPTPLPQATPFPSGSGCRQGAALCLHHDWAVRRAWAPEPQGPTTRQLSLSVPVSVFVKWDERSAHLPGLLEGREEHGACPQASAGSLCSYSHCHNGHLAVRLSCLGMRRSEFPHWVV